MNQGEFFKQRNRLLDIMEEYLLDRVLPEIEKFNQLMTKPWDDGEPLSSYEQIFDYNVYRDRIVIMAELQRDGDVIAHKYYTFKRDKEGQWYIEKTIEEEYHPVHLDLDKMS